MPWESRASSPRHAATSERRTAGIADRWRTSGQASLGTRKGPSAVVSVIDRVPHAKYGKFVLRTKKLYAHDEANDVNVGDRVRVMECRPLSKSKRWRIVEVLERAK